MTYIPKDNPINLSLHQQPATIHQERKYDHQRRCNDILIINLLPGLRDKKIRYYDSKEQISKGIHPQWLSEIMTYIDMSEGDITFLMSNLKDIAPDSSQRIRNYKY